MRVIPPSLMGHSEKHPAQVKVMGESMCQIHMTNHFYADERLVVNIDNSSVLRGGVVTSSLRGYAGVFTLDAGKPGFELMVMLVDSEKNITAQAQKHIDLTQGRYLLVQRSGHGLTILQKRDPVLYEKGPGKALSLE